MAPRNLNTKARLLEPRCTTLLGQNQIVSVSDGKGDTNIWMLGLGVWQWPLGSQRVNDRFCILSLRAMGRPCWAAAQPAACSQSSWKKYSSGLLRSAFSTQDPSESVCQRGLVISRTQDTDNDHLPGLQGLCSLESLLLSLLIQAYSEVMNAKFLISLFKRNDPRRK